MEKFEELTSHEGIGSQLESPETAANDKGRATYGGEAPKVRCRPHKDRANAIECKTWNVRDIETSSSPHTRHEGSLVAILAEYPVAVS
jgi:hypothetical protein